MLGNSARVSLVSIRSGIVGEAWWRTWFSAFSMVVMMSDARRRARTGTRWQTRSKAPAFDALGDDVVMCVVGSEGAEMGKGVECQYS